MGFPFQGTSMPITPESLDAFDDDKVASLAQRLEDDDATELAICIRALDTS